MTQRILVTGAGGFVGSYLCQALMARGGAADVLQLVAPHDSRAGAIAADLLDRGALDDVFAQRQPDVVVHLAAQSSVARGSTDTGETWAVNVSGSLNLAVAIARHVPRATVLFVSSAEVYGASFLQGPALETTPTLPLSAYGQSKLIAEDIFRAALPASAKLIIARPFNHSGPGQRESFVLPSFAAQIARIEAGHQPAELRVGNLDVIRDFLHVDDVVAAYIGLIDQAPVLPRGFLCNIASERPLPLRELIDRLREMSRRPFDVVVDPARVRHVDIPAATGDARLLRSVTGWSPTTSVEALLAALLDDRRRASGPH